ncbi:hypothetical protein D3C84_890760 [compost metagenome]
MEQQAALRRGKFHRAGEQQLVFRAVLGPRVAERRLFQADALADQPTAEAMPDHQLALGEEMVRILKLRIVQAQADHFVFAGQGQARAAGEQAIKQQAAMQCLIEIAAVNHRMTHHRETAGFTRHRPEAQVLVVECQPQSLDQAGELLRRNARTRFFQQLGADPELLQQV